MATTIAQQLSQPYVGEVVDLFHLDLRPIGQNLDFYFTPSSDRAIKFNNVTYQPLPISISGLNKGKQPSQRGGGGFCSSGN